MLCYATISEVQFQESIVLLLFFVHVMKGNVMMIKNFDDDVSSTFSLSSNNDGMDLSELGSLSRNVLDYFL